ncbi:hypothetical protein CW354_20175 [Marinicaulis flavus]|uniref:Uncharacterized protein n=1 Tax=Hyphococcus luteus TaxID=2058213 RepID=A0A2S7K035_9PROT|nr:hypothetical protein CW354_20175 [Marinicaulis flavus]
MKRLPISKLNLPAPDPALKGAGQDPARPLNARPANACSDERRAAARRIGREQVGRGSKK